MTEEVEASIEMTRRIVRPEDSVNLHSLELLLDVASNLLQDSPHKATILSTIKSAIYAQKETDDPSG